MKDLKEKYGENALICGASEGIGAAFAAYLAARGINLILVARRAGPLDELSSKLKEKFSISVHAITCDLSESNASSVITEKLSGIEPGILIYNAAVSYIGPFLSRSNDELLSASRVNMNTPLELVRSLGQKMVERKRGAVILMSSMAGMQGSGFLSLYAATKAFNAILSESLWYEWKDHGVDVIGCVAGATSTPGYVNSSPKKTSFLAPRVLKPEEIPAECFRYLGKRPSFITGRGNRIASFFMKHFMSRKGAVKTMGGNTRKMYGIEY